MSKNNKTTKKLSRLKELEAENRKLRSEVELLKHELAARGDKRIFHDSEDKVKASFEKRAENAHLFSKKHYTSYLAALISNTSAYKLYAMIVGILKKYTLITITFQLAAYILAAIQSSAIFVVAVSASIIALPITFVLGYSATMLSFFARRKIIKKIKSLTNGKEIAVFFATRKGSLEPSSFFSGMAREWRDRNGGVVIIVSPYFFSPKGISGSRKLYFVNREEDKDIIIIRRHFFFSLKKKILDPKDKNVTMIY